MAIILTLQEALSKALLRKKQKKTIVLVGGCFDILHIGHVRFLEQAKKMADILMVFLESNRKTKQLKGNNRPFFNQQERAYTLASLLSVDYVVLLPFITTNAEYTNLINQIRPNIIAVTANDRILAMKKRQTEAVGGKLKIIPYLKTYSSSKLAKIIGID